MTPLLQVEALRSGYGQIEALRGVDLEIRQGEVVSLIGANGAGKSTLLMTLFGRPRAWSGRICFEGSAIENRPTHEVARLGIAQVPEGRRIFPRLTVLENLQLGAVTQDARHFARDLEHVFEMFPRLRERSVQRGGTLSGGEQQMLAIARALVARPRLLLLDEPSLGLAPLVVRLIFEVIRDINASHGVTVFLVEQNALQALKLANRGYVMSNGRITMNGTGAELLANPEVRNTYLAGSETPQTGANQRIASQP